MSRPSFLSALLVIASMVVASPSPANAGNGKIAGRVVDAETREPLPGVNVVLTHTILPDGTESPLQRQMGNSTDAEGFYFILNVPPDNYVVQASGVGYIPAKIRNLKVDLDRTVTVHFELTQTAIEVEAVEVTAERELIKKDVSATQEVFAATRLEHTPVLRLDEFIGRTKGVELVSGAEGNGLSVRGGAIRETEVRLDGISLQDPRTENSYLALNSTSISEVQLLTGGFEAKYGGVRSGLLNVVTKDGSRDRYSVSLKADVAPANQKRFFGTNPWSDESWIYRVFAGEYALGGVQPNDTTVPLELRNFRGWRSSGTPERALDSLQKQELWNLQHPQYDFGNKVDLFLEASITGPFPGAFLPVIGDFAERTTFLLGFKYEDSQLAFPLGPRNNYVDWNTQLKLTTALESDMKLAVNGMYAKIKSVSAGRTTNFGGALLGQSASFGFLNSTDASVRQQSRLIGGGSFSQIFNKSRLQFYDQRYIVGGAKLTHSLSNSMFYTIDFQVGYTDQDLQPFALDTSRADAFVSFTSARTGQAFRYNVPQLGSPNASTNYGYDPLNMFAVYGGPQRIDSSHSRVYQLKGDLTAQLGRYHQVEAGFSVRLQDLFVYSGTWFQAQLSFTPDTWQYYDALPLDIGLYVQDKLEFEGMILNAGLRFDYLNPMKRGFLVQFPMNENYTRLLNDVYPNLPGAAGSYERWMYFRTYLDTPEGWPETDNKIQTYLSPRLGVAFPVTEASKLYFNYGHFYQRPPVPFMYNLELTQGAVTVPTPDLPMARTVSYEFGYEQMFLSEFLVNVTAYYKDVSNEPLSRTFINYYEDNIVSKYYPDAYRDIRGVELRLERPFGRFVSFSAMYDYLVTSSGASGLAQVFEDRLKAKNNELRSPNVTTIEPRPRANINLNLSTPNDFGPELFGVPVLGGLFANFFFEWRSGGRVLLNPEEPDVKLRNYVDAVDYWNIDFRGSKLISTSYGSLELVVTIKNLTNNKFLTTENMLQTQFSDYKNSLRTPDKGGSDKWGQWKSDDGHINTGWWDAPIFLNPRRIILGMRLNL
jgi:TonB dependent receptor-like, beta-barrel/Carboxypeptidase regulatory-like domain/TonB-dependent Receptor Plug Domain